MGMDTVGSDERAHYYRLATAKVIAKLKSHKLGLTNPEAQRRHAQQGANILPALPRTPATLLWARAITHPAVVGLVVSAFLAELIGQAGLAIVLLGIASLRAALHFRTSAGCDKTRDIQLPDLPAQATVIRSGTLRQIETGKLVVGDIVELKAGDTVPADVRLLTANNLAIDETALFGDRSVVEKSAAALQKTVTARADCPNLSWMGTKVIRGQATAIVTDIGAQTELGRIIMLTQTVAVGVAKTHKQWGWMSIAAAFIFGLLALVGWLTSIDGHSVVSALLVLGVAITPIGLELVNFLLAWGTKGSLGSSSQEMSPTNIKDLGNIDIVITDSAPQAKLKNAGLHVVRTGLEAKTLDLQNLSDNGLATQIATGSAVFGRLNTEDLLRLVLIAKQAGYHVAVVNGGLYTLPAGVQANAYPKTLATVTTGIEAVRTVAQQLARIRSLVRSDTLTMTLLVIIGMIGLWYFHTPLPTSAALLLTMQLVLLPVACFGLATTGKTAQPTRLELFGRSAVMTTLTYGSFLLYFAVHAVDPTYIDPASGLVAQAITLGLMTFALCQWLNVYHGSRAALSWPRLVLTASVSVVVVLNIIYNAIIQSLLGTHSLDATDWLLVLGAGGVYALFLMLQQHSRHHSRTAVTELHHAVYGRASDVRI